MGWRGSPDATRSRTTAERCRSLLKHGEPGREAARIAEEIREMIPGEMLD